VATVFEHTKLPLSVWFLAIYLMTQSKNAVSALELKRQLGVSYKAAWLLKHKLARLVYFMLTKGQAFVEAGQDEYEERYRQRVVQNLIRRAHQLGFQLTLQETSSA
jgi:hypothetical protein